MSKIDFWLSGINTVYETNNVYQALVLVSDHDVVEVMRGALLELEYPVSTIDDIQRFTDKSTRLLLVTPSDIAHHPLDTLLTCVNVVIATEAFPILTTILSTGDPATPISHFILAE
jgi:hypothetical protein